MGIVEVPPQIALECDECGERSGSEDFGGFFTYDAADPEQAIRDAIFHRLDDGRIVCDECAYVLAHGQAAAS